MSRPGKPDADWLPYEEARVRVLALFTPLPSEAVSLSGTLGRALAEEVVAPATLPPWDNSAMDGYAVRGADVAGTTPQAPLELRVMGEARAGVRWEGVLGPDEAVRIMTGGPLPSGADSVVRVEDTDGEARTGWVAIRSDRDRGRNVRAGGQDMQVGDRLLAAGERVTAGAVALAAAAGRATLSVHRQPRVGVLTSGDELRGPETFDDVGKGRGIPDSNGPLLLAAAAEVGAHGIALGPVRDRTDEIRARLEQARADDLDLLVTVGGASMGRTDLVHDVLAAMDFDLGFWRVRIRPGSPFSAGTLPRQDGSRLPVLGLPGNPASAFVTFHLFVQPALLTLAGHRCVEALRLAARAGAQMRGGAELTHFLRVALREGSGELIATPTGPQGSGLVGGLAAADGLAVVPRGTEIVEAGETVSVMLLRLPLGHPASAR